jgi:hypothetical protein
MRDVSARRSDARKDEREADHEFATRAIPSRSLPILTVSCISHRTLAAWFSLSPRPFPAESVGALIART